MDDAIRMALWIFRALTAVMWAGAVAFAAYRVYQLCTLRVVEAEVLKAETDSYLTTGEEEDSYGFRREYSTPVYRAKALVRYVYQGKTYTAVASPDTGTIGFRFTQDRLVEKWKRRPRIRVHINPVKPDQPQIELGLNLDTFWVAIILTAVGLLFVGMGYGVSRVAAYFARLMGQ
jgi:hypothetical protein